VIAYGAVLALTLAFLVLLAWGVHRLASASERPARGTPARPRPSPVRKPLVTS
jgi:flagellar biogenesis protein FliO